MQSDSQPAHDGALVVASGMRFSKLSSLTDRNPALDELISLRRDFQILQLESSRMREELSLRLTVMDNRMQACESSTRQVEKKENANAANVHQNRCEVDLRLKEVTAELQRLRRLSENDTRTTAEAARLEGSKQDERIAQHESALRLLATQCQRLEEGGGELERQLRDRVDRRMEAVLDGVTRSEHQSVERLLAVQVAPMYPHALAHG